MWWVLGSGEGPGQASQVECLPHICLWQCCVQVPPFAEVLCSPQGLHFTAGSLRANPLFVGPPCSHLGGVQGPVVTGLTDTAEKLLDNSLPAHAQQFPFEPPWCPIPAEEPLLTLSGKVVLEALCREWESFEWAGS